MRGTRPGHTPGIIFRDGVKEEAAVKPWLVGSENQTT